MTDVRSELMALADETYREFHSRLLSGTGHPILGVRVPELKKLAKRLAKEEGEAYLQRAGDGTYEEILLQGLVIGFLKEDLDRRLTRIAGYMAKIDNWAECDIVCSALKCVGREQERALLFLKPFLASEREYEVRFAVVLLLDYYIDETYIDETLSLLESVSHPGYYVRMAVAWALSVCYVKFPEKTMARLREGSWDDFTYNKALQKIVESSRVGKDTKALIRSMKR